MTIGIVREPSVFEIKTIQEIYAEIQDVYRKQQRPWVVGFSGGKDSTATLQTVWKAIAALPPEERIHPIYVIASDTRVETPVIVDHIDNHLRLINKAAQEQGLPFQAQKVVPTLNDSFWVNLIGRGYPAPTVRFRWCTERMKIKPANQFISEKVAQHGEVIMVLGVRRSESATRAQLMSTYQVQGNDTLRRHTTLPGAYVFAPIQDFSTDDVWSYLLQVPSPWGGSNRDLAALYRNASTAGECPLVIDTSTPSCGSSRFGCWVCTVALKDSSMEAMIMNGEEWMEPLLDFRDYLAKTTKPEHKHEFRGLKGRDGRVKFIKPATSKGANESSNTSKYTLDDDGRVIFHQEGVAAARTYTMETSRDMLQRLLNVQKTVQASAPNGEGHLISTEELMEIRRIWRNERQDWDDSVPTIYQDVYGETLNWSTDDDGVFASDQRALLEGLCKEQDLPFELVAKLLEVEKASSGLARRAGVQRDLGRVLNEEWRVVEEIQKGLF